MKNELLVKLNEINVNGVIKVRNSWSVVKKVDKTKMTIETSKFCDISFEEIQDVLLFSELNIYSAEDVFYITLDNIVFNLQMPDCPDSIHGFYSISEINFNEINFNEICDDDDDDNKIAKLAKDAINILEYIFKDNLNLTYFQKFGEKYKYEYEYNDYFVLGIDEDNYAIFIKNPISSYYNIALYDEARNIDDEIFEKLLNGYKMTIYELENV